MAATDDRCQANAAHAKPRIFCRQNTRLQRFVFLVSLVAAMVTGTAWGNEITQYEPVHIPEENEFSAGFLLINDDNGAIYDSYECFLLEHLADIILCLPHNQTNYVDKEDLISEWRQPNIHAPPSEVSGGWTETVDATGKLTLTHGPFGFDTWYAEQQDPDQNEMYITCGIPDSQLDGNGDGWSAYDTNDFSLKLSLVETPNMGVADNDGVQIYGDGYQYELVRNGARVNIEDMEIHSTNDALFVKLEISWDSTVVTTNFLEKSSGEVNSAWFVLSSWSGMAGETNIYDEITNGCWSAKYRMRSRW